nr:unnamed protein product [Spirometra erinaceieuropaei]
MNTVATIYEANRITAVLDKRADASRKRRGAQPPCHPFQQVYALDSHNYGREGDHRHRMANFDALPTTTLTISPINPTTNITNPILISPSCDITLVSNIRSVGRMRVRREYPANRCLEQNIHPRTSHLQSSPEPTQPCEHRQQRILSPPCKSNIFLASNTINTITASYATASTITSDTNAKTHSLSRQYLHLVRASHSGLIGYLRIHRIETSELLPAAPTYTRLATAEYPY